MLVPSPLRLPPSRTHTHTLTHSLTHTHITALSSSWGSCLKPYVWVYFWTWGPFLYFMNVDNG